MSANDTIHTKKPASDKRQQMQHFEQKPRPHNPDLTDKQLEELMAWLDLSDGEVHFAGSTAPTVGVRLARFPNAAVQLQNVIDWQPRPTKLWPAGSRSCPALCPNEFSASSLSVNRFRAGCSSAKYQ